MANETTTTSANDLLFDEFVTSEVLLEARPYNVSAPFLRFAGNQASNVYRWPIQDDPGQAASKTEGTDLSNTQLTTTKSTATLGTVALMATVTDELAFAAVNDPQSHFSGVLGRSVMEKAEQDVANLLDDFSNTTSNTGVDLATSHLLDAYSALQARDVGNMGPIVAILHTQQSGDLMRDVVTSTDAYLGNPNAKINGIDAADLSGFAGAPFDIPIYHTQLVNTANNAADRHGALFVVGQAIGKYEAWAPKAESGRDISNISTEIVASARYGVAELRDTFGQGIVSDA